MLENVLRDQCGLDPLKPLLAGVSGGPDSLCLLDVIRRAGYPVIVAHFNHRLRPEADEEAAAVSELAQDLGLPFVTDSADVAGYAAAHALSIEEAARWLRYRFLFAAARSHAAQAVAVGHTADDQVETVLMHFLRGSGLAGLKGMEYRTLLPAFDPRIPLVRPLLSLWRLDTETYCRDNDLAPHYDASNMDQQYLRNRIRQSLIPELQKYNPRFKEALQRTALALQGDFSTLEAAVEAAREGAGNETGPGWVAFDSAALARLPHGLIRSLLRRAAGSLRPADPDFGFEALERAAAFAEAPAGQRTDFVGGLHLVREAGKVYLAAFDADLPSAQWPQIDHPYSMKTSRLNLGEGWVLTRSKTTPETENRSPVTDNWSAWLDADRAGSSLTVRPPQPGDRFKPLGMDSGSVKLSDLFVNTKLPRRLRSRWPLVCAGDQIAWVPGLRLAQPFRVTEATRRCIHLELKKLPGTG